MSDTKQKRYFLRRIEIVQVILFIALLIIIARLIELQIVRGKQYEDLAREQHFGGIVLPAKRGEILSRNSKTGEPNILATNTTLDLLYVDPFVTSDRHGVALLLAETLFTEDSDRACRRGEDGCPREFRPYYADAFNPLFTATGGAVLPLAGEVVPGETALDTPDWAKDRMPANLPPRDILERQFAADIERRISEDFVSFVPLLYGATKVQRATIRTFGIPGVEVTDREKLVYANPQEIPDFERARIARILSPVLNLDQTFIEERLKKRRLRYVPVFRRMPPELSRVVKRLKEESALKAGTERQGLLQRGNKEAADRVLDPLRGIALIPEHWRFYPDGTVASQVVGFLNLNQQAQNGIERTFDHDLRGQEGRINTVTDPFGGQIVSDEQSIVQAHDGRTIVLTIDRYLQKQVEEILARATEQYQADSGQVVIIDPFTGKILVMANAPPVNSNNYGSVYAKEPRIISPEQEPSIVVEIFHPQTNQLVVRGYLNDLISEGRTRLSKELQQRLNELEKLYDLDDLKRYYLPIGENRDRKSTRLNSSH